MKRYLIILSFALFALTGCNLYKAYEKTTAHPSDLYGDVMTPGDTASIGALGWRSLFNDPLLQRLIDSAWVKNTDVRSAMLTLQQAQNDLKSARWGYAPTLSFAPQATFLYEGGAYSNNFQLPVKASWQLGIFGQTRSKIRSAKAKLAYDEDYRQAVRVSLAANVANYYYSLIMLDRQLALSLEGERLYEESYNTTQALYKAGVYNSPAVHEMQASLEDLRADIVDLRNDIATTEASLCKLLAEPPHAIERAPFEAFVLPEQLSVGFPVRLLDARPDVRMAERNMEIAYYGTQQARQAFYPSLDISAMIAYAGAFNALGFLAEAVGMLTQPIFQGGQLVAQLRNAKADQEKAKLAFVQTLYDAGNEVYKYKKACETARDKAGHIEIRVNALQEAYAATRELMDHGSTTYLEVLNAQESMLSAELTQVKNQYEMAQALINLYSALGGFGE